jgi:hypothetical protein
VRRQSCCGFRTPPKEATARGSQFRKTSGSGAEFGAHLVQLVGQPLLGALGYLGQRLQATVLGGQDLNTGENFANPRRGNRGSPRLPGGAGKRGSLLLNGRQKHIAPTVLATLR